MARLADPAVPGAQKVALIENGTAGEAAGLDRFAAALRDDGSLPLTFEARDLAWSQNGSGNVVATVTVTTANPQSGRFMYPMEFAPADGSWQLTRQTADQLLALDAPPPSTPAPPPCTTCPRPRRPRRRSHVDRLAGVRPAARRRAVAEAEAVGRASRDRRTRARASRCRPPRPGHRTCTGARASASAWCPPTAAHVGRRCSTPPNDWWRPDPKSNCCRCGADCGAATTSDLRRVGRLLAQRRSARPRRGPVCGR